MRQKDRYYFYWFRIDNKHMAEPWLDQALMCSAYRSDINNIPQFYEPASFIFSFFIYSMVSLPPITLLYITLSISSNTNVKAFQKLIQFHLSFILHQKYVHCISIVCVKELSLCHKLKFVSPYFFANNVNLWYVKLKFLIQHSS